MKKLFKFLSLFLISFIFLTNCKQETQTNIKDVVKTKTNQKDPLPSWNQTSTKKEIIAYVSVVTDNNHPEFIPVKDRIATFDNDGNLWSEQPAYFLLFLQLIM